MQPVAECDPCDDRTVAGEHGLAAPTHCDSHDVAGKRQVMWSRTNVDLHRVVSVERND